MGRRFRSVNGTPTVLDKGAHLFGQRMEFHRGQRAGRWCCGTGCLALARSLLVRALDAVAKLDGSVGDGCSGAAACLVVAASEAAARRAGV